MGNGLRLYCLNFYNVLHFVTFNKNVSGHNKNFSTSFWDAKCWSGKVGFALGCGILDKALLLIILLFHDGILRRSCRRYFNCLIASPSSNAQLPSATPTLRWSFLAITELDSQREHHPLYSYLRALLVVSPSSEQLRDSLSTILLNSGYQCSPVAFPLKGIGRSTRCAALRLFWLDSMSFLRGTSPYLSLDISLRHCQNLFLVEISSFH